MARLSGLQREVLSLYRKCLRDIRKKPVESRSNFKLFARTEFEKHLSLSKKDFNAIEYLLRKGNRQLEIINISTTIKLPTALQMLGSYVTFVHVTDDASRRFVRIPELAYLIADLRVEGSRGILFSNGHDEDVLEHSLCMLRQRQWSC